MTVDLLLGLQWGDEGKGKIVDVLTSNMTLLLVFKAVRMPDTLWNLTELNMSYALFLQAFS
jgi:hypothetical protein